MKKLELVAKVIIIDESYVKTINEKMPLECCCRCGRKQELATYITAKLLYRIAFTVWHVALHIENTYVSIKKKFKEMC